MGGPPAGSSLPPGRTPRMMRQSNRNLSRDERFEFSRLPSRRRSPLGRPQGTRPACGHSKQRAAHAAADRSSTTPTPTSAETSSDRFSWHSSRGDHGGAGSTRLSLSVAVTCTAWTLKNPVIGIRTASCTAGGDIAPGRPTASRQIRASAAALAAADPDAEGSEFQEPAAATGLFMARRPAGTAQLSTPVCRRRANGACPRPEGSPGARGRVFRERGDCARRSGPAVADGCPDG